MTKKSTFGKKKSKLCTYPGCGKRFTGEQQLRNHIKIHDRPAFSPLLFNKKIFKKFLAFLFKIILCFNQEANIQNLVGPKEIQRKIQKKYLKEGIITPIERVDINISKKNKKELENNEIKEENNDIYKFLEELEKEEEKPKEEETKENIKRNIITNISKKIGDALIIKEIKKYDIPEITYGPIFDVNIGASYGKISIRRLIKQSEIPEKQKKWALSYISKNRLYKNDYQTNEELKERTTDEIYNEIIKLQRNSIPTVNKFEELLEYINKYIHGEIKEFTCDACGKFVQPVYKKKHMFKYCKKIYDYFQDNKEKVLKKFLEENYKKLNGDQINVIIEDYKNKDLNYLIKTLRKYIKFKGKRIKVLIKNKIKKQKNLDLINEQTAKVGPIPMKKSFRENFIALLIKEVREETDKSLGKK